MDVVPVSHAPKLVLVGDSNVGKTCIAHWLANKGFLSDAQPSVGSFSFHRDLTRDGNMIHLAIWDTAGQEQYRSIVPLIYRGASIICIVASVDIASSVEGLDLWLSSAGENAPGAVVAFVLNKIDLPPAPGPLDPRDALFRFSVVDPTGVEGRAERRSIPFFGTSAATGQGLPDLLTGLIDLYLARYATKRQFISVTEQEQPDIGVHLDPPPPACC
jgi:small GTP-binding protein